MKLPSILKIVIVCMAILFTGICHAQSIFHCGPVIGFGHRTTTGPGTKSPALGGFAGLTTDFRLNKYLSFRPSLTYAIKGYYSYEWSLFGEESEENLRLNYITLDIPIKYVAPSGWCFHFGPQAGYLIVANFTDYEGVTNNAALKKKIKSIDYGLIVGAGYQLKNGLCFNLTADLGLRPILKPRDDRFYDDSILGGNNMLFTTGISYLIGYDR